MAIPKIPAGSIVQGLGMALDFTNSALNRRSQKKQNEADREHAVQMYERQRQDSISDFNRQNEYNHPEQQMERLRQAGLNPNLVYGKGADNTASAINKTSYQESKLTAPQMDFSFSNAITQFQQVQQNKAQTDNLIAMRQNIEADRLLKEKDAVIKDLTAANIATRTARSNFDLGLAQELKDSTLQGAVLQNKLAEANINITNNRDLREKQLNTQQVQETIQRTLSIKKDIAMKEFEISTQPQKREKLENELVMLDQQIANAKKDGIFKDWENMLTKRGLTKNDPVALRMLENLISEPTGMSPETTKMYTDKIMQKQKEWQDRVNKRYEEYNKRKGK